MGSLFLHDRSPQPAFRSLVSLSHDGPHQRLLINPFLASKPMPGGKVSDSFLETIPSGKREIGSLKVESKRKSGLLINRFTFRH
jgi:hypothetical protein